MEFDISRLLDEWEYQPGQVVVRRFKGKDGKDKIQLRVDLGLLQMNAEGRPDGKRPFGHPSLLEYYQARLHKYVAAHDGSDEGFKLNAGGLRQAAARSPAIPPSLYLPPAVGGPQRA